MVCAGGAGGEEDREPGARALYRVEGRASRLTCGGCSDGQERSNLGMTIDGAGGGRRGQHNRGGARQSRADTDTGAGAETESTGKWHVAISLRSRSPTPSPSRMQILHQPRPPHTTPAPPLSPPARCPPTTPGPLPAPRPRARRAPAPTPTVPRHAHPPRPPHTHRPHRPHTAARPHTRPGPAPASQSPPPAAHGHPWPPGPATGAARRSPPDGHVTHRDRAHPGVSARVFLAPPVSCPSAEQAMADQFDEATKVRRSSLISARSLH